MVKEFGRGMLDVVLYLTQMYKLLMSYVGNKTDQMTSNLAYKLPVACGGMATGVRLVVVGYKDKRE